MQPLSWRVSLLLKSLYNCVSSTPAKVFSPYWRRTQPNSCQHMYLNALSRYHWPGSHIPNITQAPVNALVKNNSPGRHQQVLWDFVQSSHITPVKFLSHCKVTCCPVHHFAIPLCIVVYNRRCCLSVFVSYWYWAPEIVRSNDLLKNTMTILIVSC